MSTGKVGRPPKLYKKAYPLSSWCFLRTSQKLRGAIRFRMEQLGFPWDDIEKKTGVKRVRISSYLNGMDRPPSQFHLIKLARYLGLKVELNVTIDYDGSQDKNALDAAEGF